MPVTIKDMERAELLARVRRDMDEAEATQRRIFDEAMFWVDPNAPTYVPPPWYRRWYQQVCAYGWNVRRALTGLGRALAGGEVYLADEDDDY